MSTRTRTLRTAKAPKDAGPLSVTGSIFQDGSIDPKDAARTYGGSEALYRKAMDQGLLPYTRIGTKRLIPKRALLEFLQRNLVPARDPSAA